MRYLTALYDAPVPALAALRALEDAGVAPHDVVVVPPPPDVHPADWSPAARQPTAAWLRDLGVSGAIAEALAEGVRRGAVLVVVRCANLSTGPLARILVVAALDLASSARRWASDPGLRYVWPGWTIPPSSE